MQHNTWTKRIGAIQICDGCEDRSPEKVLYSCTICRIYICKKCATIGRMENAPTLFGITHQLDPDSVNWDCTTKTSQPAAPAPVAAPVPAAPASRERQAPQT